MGFGVLSMALLGASCNSAKKDPVTTAEGPKTDAPKDPGATPPAAKPGAGQ